MRPLGRLLALLLLLSACARPPAALRGSFGPLSPRDAQTRAAVGERVRWGGEIVSTTPGRNETCFELHAPGRETSVIGTLAEPMTRDVGEYEYRFPVVKAETVHLWPRQEQRVTYYDPWPSPFWGPYPYWGWGIHLDLSVPTAQDAGQRWSASRRTSASWAPATPA